MNATVPTFLSAPLQPCLKVELLPPVMTKAMSWMGPYSKRQAFARRDIYYYTLIYYLYVNDYINIVLCILRLNMYQTK